MYALEMILACNGCFSLSGLVCVFRMQCSVYETKIVLRVPVPMMVLTREILLAINDHYAGDANQILCLLLNMNTNFCI